MTDVKLEPCPFCGGEAQPALAQGGGIEWAQVECVNRDCGAVGPTPATEAEAIAAWNRRHQPQEREAVLEEALLRFASRFTDYADLHAEKLGDGSLSEAQRQTARDKMDRNLRYAAEARAALNTTPAPAVSTDEIVAVLEDVCAAAEYWAGCDEGCSHEAASDEIMRSGGSWPAQSYDKARAILSRLRGEA